MFANLLACRILRVSCVVYCLLLICSLISLHAASENTPASVADDSIDVLELNHYYDQQGKHNFSQLIGWKWTPGTTDSTSQFHVAWWTLWQRVGRVRPIRDYRRGGYVLIVGHGETLRRIRARSFYESWTQHDPELLDRNQFPQSKRIGLAKPVK